MSSTFMPFLGAFIWIGFLLSIGVMLRAKITIFQKLLMPASLIGGLLGFVLMQFDLVGLPTNEGFQTIPESTFALITFHLFAFNFVGIGLAKSDKPVAGKVLAKGATWIAVMLGVTYSVQVLIGIGVFAGWNFFTGSVIETINGVLLGTGFTQGPGQAQAFASIWETGYNIENAINIGFTFAACGFLVAGLVGILLARHLILCGWTECKDNASLPKEFITGILAPQDRYPAAMETTHNANVNTLGFHLGVMLFLYGVTYLIAIALEVNTPKAVGSLAFGFLFMIGLVVAISFKKVLAALKVDYIIDNGMSKSITSACVDLLICAVFLGINLASIKSLIMPIALSVVAGTIATVFICIYFSSKLSEYGMERAMALLGYSTGTGANALLLLRIVDPKFKSPVLVEMGLVIIVQMFTIIPFSVCIPLAPYIGVYNIVLIMSAIAVSSLFVIFIILKLQNSGKI